MIRRIGEFWGHSIRRQLMLGIALVHAVMMGLFIYDLVERERGFLYEYNLKQATNLTRTLAANSTSWVLANDYAGLEEVIASLKSYSELRYAMVTNLKGKILGHTDLKVTGYTLDDPLSRSLLAGEANARILVDAANLIDVAYPVFRGEQHIGWARIGTGQQESLRGLEVITNNGLVYLFTAILIGLVFAYWMSGGLTRGLADLIDVAKKTKVGEDIRSHVLRKDEVGVLAGEFNRMLDALQKSHGALQEDIRKRRLIESQLEQMNAGLEAMVTERTGKYLKEKQKAEAANQAKSIFLSNMSHELRTPLNAILGFSQLLVKDEAVTPQQEEYLRIIQHSGEHLLRLINDILDMSKIESGQIELKEETIDLKETVRELALMMKVRADAKRLRFVYECEEGIGPFVRIDAGKLSQILINLIGNAIKYTDKGGLSLRVRLDRCEKEQCILVFEVEDSGRGMSEGELKEVFKPFVQARSVSGLQEGTGLGLAITKRYVELMKGEIEVRSDVGKGTLFRLTLPAKVMEAGNMTRSTHALTVTGIAHAKRPYRILIVEDQRENRILLRKILFSAGFEVYEAVDGAEGVAKFKEVQPDFIWMDLRMPGMDGYEATRTIRTLPGGKEVGIAALTASAFVEQHEEVLAAGCDELVHKPYREEEIFEVMRRYLGLEYTYESRQKPAAALPPEAKALDALSDTLANDLHDALIALNREAVDAAVEEIKGVDATLYEAFHSLAENYAYETLLTLLEERKKQ